MSKARDLSPAVPLPLNGKPLSLHLDMAALWDYEEAMRTALIEETRQVLVAGLLTSEEASDRARWTQGTTVGEFLRPLVGLMQEFQEETGATSMDELRALPAENRSAAGLRMLEQVLDSGLLEARKLTLLVWAMAGGEKLGESPHEFGRRVNWADREALIAAVTEALRNGYPAEQEDEGEAEVATGEDGEDPITPPESSTTGG